MDDIESTDPKPFTLHIGVSTQENPGPAFRDQKATYAWRLARPDGTVLAESGPSADYREGDHTTVIHRAILHALAQLPEDGVTVLIVCRQGHFVDAAKLGLAERRMRQYRRTNGKLMSDAAEWAKLDDWAESRGIELTAMHPIKGSSDHWIIEGLRDRAQRNTRNIGHHVSDWELR